MGRVKKVVAILLVFSLMAGYVLPDCVSVSHAAGVSGKGAIEYCVSGTDRAFTDSAEEAFRACRYGGEIYFNSDYHLDIREWTEDLVCSERTLIEVKPGVTLTLGKSGLKMRGQLQIWGTVDLEKSEGDLWGTEQVNVRTGGRLVKRPYKITCNGDTAFATNAITYGQPLSEAKIKEENVYWKSSIKGEWSFVSPSLVYEAGTWKFAALFKPERPFTYDETFYNNCTVVKIEKAIPKLQESSVPEIYYGQTLSGVKPQYSFVNPYSGVPVEGTLTFMDENEILGRAGEQQVVTIFKPDDSANYDLSCQSIKVKVLSVMPDVVSYPQPCNQGEVGQSLQDIRLLPGQCRNPHTGKDIKGSWKWKEPLKKLQPGENSYTVLFVPEEKGYKTREGSLTLKVLPKETPAPSKTPFPSKTPSPTEKGQSVSSVNTVKNQMTAQSDSGKKSVSGDKPPIVITRMVSRRSTIRFAKKKMLSAKTKIKKIKRSESKAKIVCKRIAKVKYEVQYSTGKKWKSAKRKYSASPVMTIRKLKVKKKYYFRVRVWKKVKKKKVYGRWSGVKRK